MNAGRYDYYDEAEQAQMSRMNYPTVPEAMSLSRSAQHHDSPQSNGAGSQPPQLPSIVYSHSHPHGNGGGGGSAAAGNGMQYLAVQPGGRLSPRLLAAAAPPTNVRPTTRQAGNEFYTIPQIDMPKIKLRVRGNSARYGTISHRHLGESEDPDGVPQPSRNGVSVAPPPTCPLSGAGSKQASCLRLRRVTLTTVRALMLMPPLLNLTDPSGQCLEWIPKGRPCLCTTGRQR